jgi:hypothetical protein
MWISWTHRDSDFSRPLTFEQKVDVFYEQTLGWQLHIADLMANGGRDYGEAGNREGPEVSRFRHSGFAVLQVCVSFFELVGSLVGPAGTASNADFRAGVEAILGPVPDSPEGDAFLRSLYKRVRCGLYHDGRMRGGTGLGIIGGPPTAFDPRSNQLVVDPHDLPRVMKRYLEDVRRRLLDPQNVELRRRFRERFDSGFEEPGRGARD